MKEETLCRIQQDLKDFYKDPLDGIFVAPDENRDCICHALIYGPSDTPYEFGVFYFVMEFPDDYPFNPPSVTLQNTGGICFNLNLKSVLSNHRSMGPSWSPAQTIRSILFSIQSLFNSNPSRNRSNFKNEFQYEQNSMNLSKYLYNHFVRHETIRVAVLDIAIKAMEIVKNDKKRKRNKLWSIPLKLAEMIIGNFWNVTEIINYTCDEYKFLDGSELKIIPGEFQFSKLKDQIEELRWEWEEYFRWDRRKEPIILRCLMEFGRASITVTEIIDSNRKGGEEFQRSCLRHLIQNSDNDVFYNVLRFL